MKTATVKAIKSELEALTHAELMQHCLQLSKFKKENKELLSYLLFECSDEEGFILNVKDEVDSMFEDINTSSYYFIKKSVRKILRTIKKYIRYSKKKPTEIELLLHFCVCMKNLKPSITRHTALHNIYLRELAALDKKILLVHEDLQYDYNQILEEIRG